MENKLCSIILAIFLITIGSCDIMDSNKLLVLNNSSDTVYCLWSTENNFSAYTYSPFDQSIESNGKKNIFKKSNNILYANDSSLFSSYDWEHDINSSKNKQLVLFFFKLKTLQERDWNELKDKVIYDKKIVLSYDELKKQNWKVVYDDK